MWAKRMGGRLEGGVGALEAGGTHLRVLLNFHHYYHSGMLVGVKDYLVTFVFRYIGNLYCNVKALVFTIAKYT